MTERRTDPIRSTYIEDWDEFLKGEVPGAIHQRAEKLWYCCPCGCGAHGGLLVGIGHKPSVGPSWNWNGSRDNPTLHPSVHHLGHWHGRLVDGTWRSA